ncbi:MAG TPA: hypothetical protein VFZ25_12915 [Chloroflexota bacterium]|nr:hypothetical protein [Chloroflexota bacterium]
MVTPSAITNTHIENALINIRDMLADMPELASEHDTGVLPEDERISWSLDWDQAMGTDLRILDQADNAARLNEDQQRRYHEVIKSLREGLPLIRRLGLSEPTVPLDEAA